MDTQRAPTQSSFKFPLLRALGRMADFTSGKPIPRTPENYDVILREAGFDPNAYPRRPSKVRGAYAGTERGIDLAYRDHYLMNKRTKTWPSPLTFPLGKEGAWALTDAGVEVARALCDVQVVVEPPPAPPPVVFPVAPSEPPPTREANLTARWFEENLKVAGGQTPALLVLLRKRIAKRCPVSATTDQLDDHINTYIALSIKRNAFRDRLSAGEKISPSQVASWAIRSAFRDIRGFGTEPVTRELFGALTERERARGERYSANPVEVRDVLYNDGGEILEMGDTAQTPEDTLVERRGFEMMWSRVEDALKEAKGKNADNHQDVLRLHVVWGYTPMTISTVLGISQKKVASTLADARKVLRKMGKEGVCWGMN